MFLDVFDLVLANILPDIEEIFKGECVFRALFRLFPSASLLVAHLGLNPDPNPNPNP